MPGKTARSARSRRHDDKTTELLTKAIPKRKPGQQVFVEGVPLADALWNSTRALRKEVLQTYLINGLNNGTVDPVKFGQYVVQDAVYCYKSKVDIDVVASRTTGSLRDFFLEESADYEEYYKGMFEAWSIGEPKGIHLNPTCQAYADLIAKIAVDRDPVYSIVAGIPCVRLWPWIGQKFKQSGKSSGLYQKWVDENFDPTGTDYLKWEAYVNNSTDIDVATAKKIYYKCMKGELGFFSSIKE